MQIFEKSYVQIPYNTGVKEGFGNLEKPLAFCADNL